MTLELNLNTRKCFSKKFTELTKKGNEVFVRHFLQFIAYIFNFREVFFYSVILHFKSNIINKLILRYLEEKSAIKKCSTIECQNDLQS